MGQEELAHECCNCNYAHPAAPFQSEYAICLNDEELAPYLDDILDEEDFSRCADLVRRKRFDWEREACEQFEPIDDSNAIELSEGLAQKINQLHENGELTADTLKQAIAVEAFESTDWANHPIDAYMRELNNAASAEARKEAIHKLGFLIRQNNCQAFEALCDYLRNLPPPESNADKDVRIKILDQLSVARDENLKKVAFLLVDDLFRTPSNNTTRGWYTKVFNYFERICPQDIAVEALRPIVNSQEFSHRIKKRVRNIIEPPEDTLLFLS